MYKKTAHKRIWLLILLLLGISVPVCAQSSYTRSGINAALFNIESSLNDDGSLKDVGGRLGYSIGGVLDVGAVFSVNMDEIESQSSTETNIGIFYGIVLVKQENFSPVSLELSGSYGYSILDSSYFEDNDLQTEGHGYNIQLQLLRDFALSDSFHLRFGIFGGYRNYNYTIQLTGLETEEGREIAPERETLLKYGGNLTAMKKSPQGRTFYIGGEPVMTDKMDFSVTIRTGVVFEL
ncbi:hypothetical protein B4O97_16005 [Marispirochaeta aestuarii]|uniref:Outer membrane protein beta-barrel domain-containing protein n=1 Tax=Marispirochaeta aestuarii TaxID=1963862 RepID=A0A1Y1RUF6_9SPIO|nr:hypothetical protein [Marispirochaeta aestuarii]ORC32662.1 hypothetical protein B4O97_16005 [Marispirochaeta aestuarii]